MAGSTPRSASAPRIDGHTLARYADLIVGFGANVQRGQIVELRSETGKEPLTRAIAEAAYRRGALFVDVFYCDPFVRRARLLNAADDTLDCVPSWHRDRVLESGRQRRARSATPATPNPAVVAAVGPARAARDRFPFIPEYIRIINDNTTNWCGAACPTTEWAAVVHPQLEREEAYAKLWEQVLQVCRLDRPDPLAAWQERLDALARAKAALNERRFDALRFEGAGTELTVGLLPTSRWDGGLSETVDGIPFLANLPTEEVFTAPDPERTEGIVRSTKPLQMRSGITVRDLVVRFERGRAVAIEASQGVEALRSLAATDEGAARLGEVALVDRESCVGQLDTVFSYTLLDENAASHVALGSAYLDTVGEEDRERANDSAIHVDFMVGGDDVDVTGITREGERVPILRGGAWQI